MQYKNSLNPFMFGIISFFCADYTASLCQHWHTADLTIQLFKNLNKQKVNFTKRKKKIPVDLII